MTNEKIGLEYYDDFWKISRMYGNGIDMRKKLVGKWISRYEDLNEGNRIMFWMYFDETESVEKSFKMIEG